MYKHQIAILPYLKDIEVSINLLIYQHLLNILLDYYQNISD